MGKEQCVSCRKEFSFTTLKYKPKKEWNMEGHLCGDCYRKKDSEGKPEQTREIFNFKEKTEEELTQQIQLLSEDTQKLEELMKIGIIQALTGERTENILKQGFKLLAEQNRILLIQLELLMRTLERHKTT